MNQKDFNKLKPGDVISIKEDLIVGKMYGKSKFILHEFMSLDNNQDTVLTIVDDPYSNHLSKRVDNGFYYTKEMLK